MQHAMYLPCRGSHLILFSCSCNNLSLAEAGVGSNVSGPEGRPIKGVAHVMKLHQCRKSSDDALIASGVVVGRKAFRVFELRRSPGPIVNAAECKNEFTCKAEKSAKVVWRTVHSNIEREGDVKECTKL